MLKAELRVPDRDGSVRNALAPESERSLPRTEIDMTEDGAYLNVTIRATDSSAMRAALNSYLGWIRITENIGEVIE